jgi:uncharacterized protein with von Willebrand factor type A (vWA) domain
MDLNSEYRYSEWDNSQQINPFDAQDVIDAISEDLLDDGDLESALQRLYRWGDKGRLDHQLEGLKQLMERLRKQREDLLGRHNLNGMMEDIQRQLQDIVETERSGIDRRLEESRQAPPADSEHTSAEDNEMLRKMLENMAAKKQEYLDHLPQSVPQQFQALSQYDFMDPEARDKFNALRDSLRQQVMQSYFQGMQQAIQSITPEDLARSREMVRDLNQMLEDRMQGKEPKFEEFMQKYGDMFPGVNSLDELLAQLAHRMAAMQAMMDSLSPEMREQLQQMMDQLIGDDRLRADLARLAGNLSQIFPDMPGRRYPFQGDEPLSMLEAMGMMERLQMMDELEAQLRAAQQGEGLEDIDAERMRQALGPEEAAQLERLQQITKMLEEAGYIQKKGDRWELTARGIRKIGQRALQDVFGHLKRDSFGRHQTVFRGTGGERIDETKPYEFGDPFLLDIEKTAMNAIQRQGRGTPVHLQPEDFEVYRTEFMTQSATVLMLDMSRSMFLNNCFAAAKKVALALHSLIKGQYPRDVLHIVGFSYLAREISPEDLPSITWDEFKYGTNLQHALMLGRQLLARSKSRNKQIIVITDGEPTTHLVGGTPVFNYPPTLATIQETLREVVRCTRDQVVINTFMLESGYYLADFVGQMTKVNRGRAFFATPDNLGEYILVDYVANKRKKVS